jgi:hypothetical protein
MIIVAVKLFSILMNLGKIVLQVAVVLKKLSSQYIQYIYSSSLYQSETISSKTKTFMLGSKMMTA